MDATTCSQVLKGFLAGWMSVQKENNGQLDKQVDVATRQTLL